MDLVCVTEIFIFRDLKAADPMMKLSLR